MQRGRYFKFVLILFHLCAIVVGCEDPKSTPIPGLHSYPPLSSFTAIPTLARKYNGATLSPSASPTSHSNPSLEVHPSATQLPTSISQTGAPQTRYKLSATLDYAAHSLFVEEDISFHNRTQFSLTFIPLVVEPARFPGAFHLETLSWKDGSRITSYQLKGTRLALNLPFALLPDETTDFSLSYTLKLPYTSKLENIRPYPFGYTELQTNFGDWYPFIPPYDEHKRWLIHKSGFYGEYLVYDIADFEVDIRLSGEQTDLVFAASAPAENLGDHLHYTHPSARSFAWSASPYYQVISQTVETQNGSTINVESYFFPFNEGAADRIARTISQALPLYSNLFGIEYSRPSLSAVQADFLDGMEYDGMFFLSKDFYNWYNGSSQDFLVALSAHETAHQWFYSLVGNDQALEPWLDEALCTYSERLFYEHFYPESLAWWWSYRINYYDPKGWIDMTIYDVPQVTGHYRDYRDAVYLNGALFLEELRALVGEEAFFDSLISYINKHKYKLGNSHSFLLNFTEKYALNLESLLCKYFLKYSACR